MKNEEVINRLEESLKRDCLHKCDTYSMCSCCCLWHERVLQALALLKDESWILVSEMPKDKEPCYWVPRNCIDRIEVCVLKYFAKKRAEFERDFSHWMPIVLPKPTCSSCGGSEEVYDSHETGGRETGDMIPCPKCQPCSECEGSGRKILSHEISLDELEKHEKANSKPEIMPDGTVKIDCPLGCKPKEPPKKNRGCVPEEPKSDEFVAELINTWNEYLGITWRETERKRLWAGKVNDSIGKAATHIEVYARLLFEETKVSERLARKIKQQAEQIAELKAKQEAENGN